MRDKNKILASAVITAIALTNLVSAQEITTVPAPFDGSAATPVLPAPPVNKEEGMAQLKSFLRTDLSGEEQANVKAAFDAFRDTISSINTAGTPVRIGSEQFNKIVEANTKLYASLTQYVDPSKAESFTAFVKAKLAMFNSLPSAGSGTTQQRPVPTSDANRPAPNANDGGFFSFVRKMNEEEQKALKSIVDIYVSNVKAIIEDKSLTESQKAEKIKYLNTYFSSHITSYIDSSKIDAFNAFVANAGSKPLLPKNEPKKEQPKQENKKEEKKTEPKKIENKKNVAKAKVLSQRTRENFNKKLDSIPSEKKLEIFKKLIQRIEDISAKVTAEKAKAQLAELKEIVNQKLGDLQDQSGEGDIVNQVLSGMDPSDSSSSNQ